MTTIFFCTVHFISQSNIALSSVELLFYASRSMIPFATTCVVAKPLVHKYVAIMEAYQSILTAIFSHHFNYHYHLEILKMKFKDVNV